MRRLRWIPILTLVGLAVAACSGAGYGGGAYGGGAPSSPAQTVAPAASVVSVAAPSAAPSAGASAGASSGGGRRDYSTGTASASPAGAGSAAPGTVLLSGFKFEPATMTVAAGTTLSFTNGDSIGHTVVQGENGTPAAGQTPVPVAPGKTVTIPFAAAGTVKLTCTIHPSMSMTVTVTP